MKTYCAFIIAIALVAVGCKKENTQNDPTTKKYPLILEVQLTDGVERIGEGDTTSLQEEYDLYLTSVRMYLSHVTLRNDQGERTTLAEVALLSPLDSDDNRLQVKIPEGQYEVMELGLGLDQELNDSDPGSFDNSHPLATYQSMYWSMLKYRFLKIEGRARSRITGQDDITVSMHPGTDDLYQSISRPVNVSTGPGRTPHLVLSFNFNKLLDGPAGKIDLATEGQTHSEPSDIAIAQKLMINLAAAAKLDLQESL